MRRTAISRDSVRRSGDVFDAASGPTSQRPSQGSYQFSIQSTIVTPTSLSAANADRSNAALDRGYVTMKQSNFISLTVNCTANSTTSATTFSVTINGIPTSAIVVVPAGTVGVFSDLDAPSPIVPGDKIGMLATSLLGVGTCTCQCLVNVNA